MVDCVESAPRRRAVTAAIPYFGSRPGPQAALGARGDQRQVVRTCWRRSVWRRADDGPACDQIRGSSTSRGHIYAAPVTAWATVEAAHET